MNRNLIFLTCAALIFLAPLGIAQEKAENSQAPNEVVAEDLKLTFSSPALAGPPVRHTATVGDGKKITQFIAENTQAGFRAELSFVPGSHKLDQIEIWQKLEKLVTTTIKTSKAQLNVASPCWVHGFPGFRYEALILQEKEQKLHIEGQFLLVPDGILMAQTIGRKTSDIRRAASADFFGSIRRLGVHGPKTYRVKFGPVTVSHPVGVFPRINDGFLQLQDEDRHIGLLFRLETPGKTDRRETICALAQSMDAMTQEKKASLALLQGPGKTQNAPSELPALGFTGMLSRRDQESASLSPAFVVVRYYELPKRRLFVSAFAKPQKLAKDRTLHREIVESILRSIQVADE